MLVLRYGSETQWSSDGQLAEDNGRREMYIQNNVIESFLLIDWLNWIKKYMIFKMCILIKMPWIDFDPAIHIDIRNAHNFWTFVDCLIGTNDTIAGI